jgi:hypothetical protein
MMSHRGGWSNPDMSGHNPERAGRFPSAETAIERLASAAHEFWCVRMLEQGWQAGATWDQAARIHDALVPFEQLGHDDRWTAIESVEALQLVDSLVAVLEYPRGQERPLTTQDMAAGRPVISTAAEGLGSHPWHGRIVDWAVHPRSRRLQWVRVEWENGRITTHSPLEHELRLAP